MRQDPIEISFGASRKPPRAQTPGKLGGTNDPHSEPYAIDEAFARFEPPHAVLHQTSDPLKIERCLVSDLTAQLNAINRRCTQLAQRLREIELISAD